MLASLCRRPGWVLAASLVLIAPAAAEDPAAARIARLFAPFRTDTASLSPDGKYLAFSEHENGTLSLKLVALETNKARRVDVSEDYVEPMSGVREKLPSRLTFLRWKSPTRLVFSVDDNVIWAINADGSEPHLLISARDVRTDWQQKRERNPTLNRAGQGRGLFSRRPNTPDMPADSGTAAGLLGSRGNDEDIADASAGLPSADTADVFAAFSLAWKTDRHPVVANLLDDDPDNILVEARSNTGLLDDAATLNGAEMSATLFRVNVRTGKTKEVEDVDAAGRLLADRSGQPRLALHFFNTQRSFDIYTSKRWQNLDRQVPTLAAAPFRLTPENFLGRHSFPLGFGRDPELLYIASNADRDTYGIYGVNLSTGQRTDFAIEHPTLDLADPGDALHLDPLVYDRAQKKVVGVRVNATQTWPGTAWFDPELDAVQRALERGGEKRLVQILEWDAKRENFLVHLAGESDPGAFMIFQRAGAKLLERARCAPDLPPEALNRSVPFVCKTPAGLSLSGIVTYPTSPRLTPPPVILYFHDGPWGRDVPGFNRGAQALATMGFAVVQANYRGSGGSGLQYLMGTKLDFDRAAVDDALAALEYLAGKLPLNRRLVATLGTGYGGYLALRALQLHPGSFRAGVALNAPTDLAPWINQQPDDDETMGLPPPASFRTAVRRALFGTDYERLRAMSPLRHAAELKAPVLLIHGSKDQIVPPIHSVRLRDALKKSGTAVSYLELSGEGHANWRPSTSTRVFREIEMFMNENIYNYAVRTGEPVIVPEK